MKILKVLAISSLVLGFTTSSLFADVDKGQRSFVKFLKEPCGMDGTDFAAKHTQDDWENISKEGKFAEELNKLCPTAKSGDISEKDKKDIMDFLIHYASDSGNAPSC
ncbi:cytochrome C [Arcobacter sp. FW59]|nr:cytochrome C [Arcobacter sp. FW59]